MERNPVLIEAFDDEIEMPSARRTQENNNEGRQSSAESSPSNESPSEPKTRPQVVSRMNSREAKPPEPQVNKAPRGRPKKSAREEFKFPVQPKTVQVVKKPRTIVNHSYLDFSCVPEDMKDTVGSNQSEAFPLKIHEILSNESFQGYACWMPHGRAFRVNIPKRFEEKVCPKYFGHSRFSSFLRQLNNYGFKHISKGTDRNCYYHQCFLKGLPHLTKYMPKPKNARRLAPDPQNEPNFYKIAEMFPLPRQSGASNSSTRESVTSSAVPVAKPAPQPIDTSEQDKKPSARPSVTAKPALKPQSVTSATSKPAPPTVTSSTAAASVARNSTTAAAAAARSLLLTQQQQQSQNENLKQLVTRALLQQQMPTTPAITAADALEILRQRQVLAQTAAAIQERNNNNALLAALAARQENRTASSFLSAQQNVLGTANLSSNLPASTVLNALQHLQRFQ
mmetsp:Transcript_10941/g.15416  ORF Transcript_10941/g.15416 Transcript_10941/m.15416 type:complete len:452 (+) Transcript_10941:101-1456(+)